MALISTNSKTGNQQYVKWRNDKLDKLKELITDNIESPGINFFTKIKRLSSQDPGNKNKSLFQRLRRK